MRKLSEIDIRLGGVVITPEGEGVIESADRRKESVCVALECDIRKLKEFKIIDLSLKFGTLLPSVTEQIGDIAIIFSRIEDRLKDFLNFVFDFKNTKQKILLIKEFSANRSIDTINDIIKDCYSSGHKNLLKWQSIYNSFKKLIEIRNNIIHGSMFNTKDEYIFANNKKINNIRINQETQVFNFEKLSDIAQRLYTMYYDIMLFLGEICNEVRNHINKSDEDI